MIFLRRIAAVLAWAVLAYIGFVTLSPIEERPHVGMAMFERAMAFGLTGFLFATAYHRYTGRILALVVGAAIALELAQLVVPGRHAEFADAVEKIIGGGIGVLAAYLLGAVTRFSRTNRAECKHS
ncbi:MAG: VanZ family protein [Mesorhizobium sp.]